MIRNKIIEGTKNIRLHITNHSCTMLCLWSRGGENLLMTCACSSWYRSISSFSVADTAAAIHACPSWWSIGFCLRLLSVWVGCGEMLVRVLVQSHHTSRTPRQCRESCISGGRLSRLLVGVFSFRVPCHLSLFVKVTLSSQFLFSASLLPEQLPSQLLSLLLYSHNHRPACYLRGSQACLGQYQVL